MGCTSSTAEVGELLTERPLIYALGGGMGHLQRAANLLWRSGPGVVLHQAAREVPVPEGSQLVRLPEEADADWVNRFVAEQLTRCGMLVVDTFPGGIGHELRSDVVGLRPSVLVQRYVIPGTYDDYEALASQYDVRLLPYAADRCEWEGADGVYVGPIARRLRFEGPLHGVVVIGDVTQLPLGWQRQLDGAPVVHGPFDSLPRARRYVAVGAGYNLFWELDGRGAAHLPLPRRYDDQFRRAGLWGRAITTRRGLYEVLDDAG